MGETANLRAIGAGEFLKLELPPREFLLSPWLSTQGLAMIHAPRGVGKTHVSLGIAFAIATGTSFLRWEAPQAREVLFIDGEMPANLLQERLAAIVNRVGVCPTGNLRIITPDLQENGIPDLSTVEGQRAINAMISRDTALLVIDNLSTLMRSGVENEGESWAPVQAWALQHRAQGRSVLFIHHSGKGGAQRGTSRREDVLDTVLALRRADKYTPDQGAAFEVHFEKARALHGHDVEPFRAHLMAGPAIVPLWEVHPIPDDDLDQVATLYNMGRTQKEISTSLGMHKSTVSRNVRRAEQRGLLNIRAT